MRRRGFVLATLGGMGALIVGWGLLPPRQRLHGSEPLLLREGEIALTGWVKVGSDGAVTVMVPRCEMGQGVHTALPMLVAEELDCGWNNVRSEASPIDRIYGNVLGLAEGVPFHPDDTGALARGVRWTMTKVMRELGFMTTGGSASVRDLWQPLRDAAALTRATLIDAAATAWGVRPDEIQLLEGVLTHASGKRATLGEMVRDHGANLSPAERYSVKDPARFRLIGRAIPRLDSSAKTDGSAQFGIDVRQPGMLYAALSLCPTRGGSVRSMDDSAVRTRPGVAAIVRLPPLHGGSGGVAVVAWDTWQAQRALEGLKIQWEPGAMAGVTSQSLLAALHGALAQGRGYTFREIGNVDAALSTAPRTLEAEYYAPYLAHAVMEPLNCTVELKDGRATIWAGTQVPGFARAAAAQALGIDEEAVRIVVPYLGSGFGRRLEVDHVAQAATVARALPGRAVQVLWSREDDIRHDFYRPACLSRFTAGLSGRGELIAWRNVSAGQAIVPGYMPRNAGLPVLGPDKTTAEGAFDQAYAFPNAAVSHVTVDLPVPVGFWRSVGHSHQAFFKECFLDEVAHAAGTDPLRMRLALLRDKPRHAAVLNLAAQHAGWGTPVSVAADGASVARGLALHESFGSIVAQVAEVSLDAGGAPRVHRVVCALDCGIAVNPGIIRQQMESAIAFGICAALYGQIDFEQGRVTQGNFHDYPVLRMSECPSIETHIVASSAPPGGIGEPGLPPIAPAIGNALFVLTGKRVRSLPIRIPA